MIIPVMAISNLVLTQQIYSEETNGAHAHNRDRVPLILLHGCCLVENCAAWLHLMQTRNFQLLNTWHEKFDF